MTYGPARLGRWTKTRASHWEFLEFRHLLSGIGDISQAVVIQVADAQSRPTPDQSPDTTESQDKPETSTQAPNAPTETSTEEVLAESSDVAVDNASENPPITREDNGSSSTEQAVAPLTASGAIDSPEDSGTEASDAGTTVSEPSEPTSTGEEREPASAATGFFAPVSSTTTPSLTPTVARIGTPTSTNASNAPETTRPTSFNDFDGDSESASANTVTAGFRTSVSLDEAPVGTESVPPDAILANTAGRDSNTAIAAGDSGLGAAPGFAGKPNDSSFDASANSNGPLVATLSPANVPQDDAGTLPLAEDAAMTGAEDGAFLPSPSLEGSVQAAELERLLSFGADVLASCTPFDKATIEGAIDQLLVQLDELDLGLTELSETVGFFPTLIGAAVTITVAGGVRRRLRGQRERKFAWLDAEEDMFFPGLPGRHRRLSAEEI